MLSSELIEDNPFCGLPPKPQGNYWAAFWPITNPLSDQTFPLGIVHSDCCSTAIVVVSIDESDDYEIRDLSKEPPPLSRIYNCPDLLKPVVYGVHLC